MLEIDTQTSFEAWLAAADRPPAAVQALDLATYGDFADETFSGSIFLECKLTDAARGHLASSGALVLNLPGTFPFEVHRSALYTPEQIFAGYDGTPEGYAQTYDKRVFDHYEATGRHQPSSIAESLARRLHDHAMTDALEEFIEGKKVVAMMGGHSLERRDPEYARVARISRALTRRGFLMTSGGGPGAMEATHVGAWFAHFDDAEMSEAIAVLARRPAGAPEGKEYADPDWLSRAYEVRARWPIENVKFHSLGIPTWLYGHEPPAAFATQIAKYFANSVREEGLLAIARYGVVFARGSAGTIQEIFQDAAQNHYRSYGVRSPMVLLGGQFWREEAPVWPLLQKVSAGRIYDQLLYLEDDESDVIARIVDYDPSRY